jgi:Leucine-rich repeat (LRR) protein
VVVLTPVWNGGCPLRLPGNEGFLAPADPSLELPGTMIENLEPLEALTALLWLDLSNTKVENLEPLKALTALLWLDVSETKVENNR